MSAGVLSLDLDGVVADFVTGFQRALTRTLGRHVPIVDRTTYDLATTFAVPATVIDDVFQAGVEDGTLFASCPVIPGARDAVAALADAGWTIHVVTDRDRFGYGDQCRAVTEAWLTHHRIPYDALTLTADKSSVEGITAIVDDHPDHIAKFLSTRTGPALLVDTTWNRHCTFGTRVASLRHAADELTRLTPAA